MSGLTIVDTDIPGHGLLIPDAMIAATAITQGYPLISKNQRDFRFIADLQLLSYPV